jgi:chromosome segregation ATPase
MNELEDQLRRINEKLQHLLRQRDLLLKENGKLKEEIKTWKEQHSAQTIRLEQLQQQVEILKASKGEMNEAEKKALDRRLGQYVREIDRCITLLGE